jgi:uncharacterized protein GlcG (DUF336 family)
LPPNRVKEVDTPPSLSQHPRRIGRWTGSSRGAPSGGFARSTQPGGDDWGRNTTDPRFVVYAGGIPLLVDGELVGAIGASGGTAQEDEECVVAAAGALGFS